LIKFRLPDEKEELFTIEDMRPFSGISEAVSAFCSKHDIPDEGSPYYFGAKIYKVAIDSYGECLGFTILQQNQDDLEVSHLEYGTDLAMGVSLLARAYKQARKTFIPWDNVKLKGRKSNCEFHKRLFRSLDFEKLDVAKGFTISFKPSEFHRLVINNLGWVCEK